MSLKKFNTCQPIESIHAIQRSDEVRPIDANALLCKIADMSPSMASPDAAGVGDNSAQTAQDVLVAMLELINTAPTIGVQAHKRENVSQAKALRKDLKYHMTLWIPSTDLEEINKYLTAKSEDEYQGEESTISYTVTFPDGKEMDIKCCGCKDGPSWTEAVLFDENGGQISYSDAEANIEGLWELDDDGITYIVDVKISNCTQTTKKLGSNPASPCMRQIPIRLVRRRDCGEKIWVDDLYLIVDDGDYEANTKQWTDPEFVKVAIATMAQEWLSTQAGWKSNCETNYDYNWGDLTMDLPLNKCGMTLSPAKDPAIPCESATVAIMVDQDQHLAPDGIVAEVYVPGNDESLGTAKVDFNDGMIVAFYFTKDGIPDDINRIRLKVEQEEFYAIRGICVRTSWKLERID